MTITAGGGGGGGGEASPPNTQVSPPKFSVIMNLKNKYTIISLYVVFFSFQLSIISSSISSLNRSVSEPGLDEFHIAKASLHCCYSNRQDQS